MLNSLILLMIWIQIKLKLEIDDFSFSLSDAPFDINDENTWAEGLLPVGKLFFNFMEDLINKSIITVSEMEQLKTKCLRLEGSNFRLGGIAPITRAVPSF